MVFFSFLACAPGERDSGAAPYVPRHNECLPEGEAMSEATCRAVVEEDGRLPTHGGNKSGTEPDPVDPRLSDPEFLWMTAEVRRCTCSCCHTESWGGPGVYYWNLEFAPVWTDSASSWTLSVFAGLTGEANQTLPTDDLERLQAWVEAEGIRREAR
ncbi:hypothetical protein LBMAG42_22620 [Deltaproteobacteria bacterium]|nr:hypothetical protein LBMAG42_22620 [Deltaproteobacteria bacterium]